jgi:hypothetical protein
VIHPNNYPCANGHIHWSRQHKLNCERKGKPRMKTTIDLREWLALKAERDSLLKALDRIVAQDLSHIEAGPNAKLLLAIAIAYELLARLEKSKAT